MGQVVRFTLRAPRAGTGRRVGDAAAGTTRDGPPVDDIGRYERAGEDDYRHRMIMNGLALVICLLLAGSGVWLANQIAEMRKNQDCVLSGRINCAKIAVPPPERSER
jgi:hypothetical protein